MLKFSDKELRLSKSEIYLFFIKRRSRLSWSLISLLIGLMIGFNLVTIFTPDLINRPVVHGSVITLGITLAFLIVFLIAAAAIYYVRWNNNESIRMLGVCRSFPGPAFAPPKGAVKLHTLLDLRGSIPTFIHISEGKLHDVKVPRLITARSGCHLPDGPRLSGLQPSLHPPSVRGLPSSSAPSPIGATAASIPDPSTNRPASSATKPSSSPASTPPRTTRTNSAESR